MCNARDPAASGDDRSVAGGTACADKTLKGQKGDVTALLSQWSSADRPFIDDLYRLVKDDLHRIAAACMRREGPDHILQATALVNEAYLKLVEPHAPYKDRSHFFALAARPMRHVLVDEARRQNRRKRGGACIRVELDDHLPAARAQKTSVI